MMPNSQPYPLKLYLINNIESSLILKIFLPCFCSRVAQFNMRKKLQIIDFKREDYVFLKRQSL